MAASTLDQAPQVWWSVYETRGALKGLCQQVKGTAGLTETTDAAWSRVEVLEMLQPCDPDVTVQLVRRALNGEPDDVDLELVFELVAQLVADLRGWPLPP